MLREYSCNIDSAILTQSGSVRDRQSVCPIYCTVRYCYGLSPKICQERSARGQTPGWRPGSANLKVTRNDNYTALIR